MKKILQLWNRLPPRLQQWLRGLEVFVLTGIVTALLKSPSADFTTRAGLAKYFGEILAVAGSCVRLYLAQSPIQTVLFASQARSEDPLSK